MGEQSVGKSFTLNHLVDTSFVGSATGQFVELPSFEIEKITEPRGYMDVRFSY
jgi:hypothetical protein